MFRPGFAIVFLLCTCGLGWGEERRRVAGRTVDQYAAQLDDDVRVVRLRAIRSLGAFGATAAAALQDSLDHEDAAVRYIAAVHLGEIGGDSLIKAKPRLSELAADQTSLAVRLAASFALCRAGLIDEHLPLLIRTLEFPERGTVCSTAELIGNIGPSAVAAINPLRTAYEKNRPGAKGGDYHIGGATMNALRKIHAQQD